VLIGEDLGNVEPWVRDYLAARGVSARACCGSSARATGSSRPSTTGESPGDGQHARPAADRRLPRRRARRAAGAAGPADPPVEEELADADAERAAVLALLRDRGLLGDAPTEQEVIAALYAFITATPSQLVGGPRGCRGRETYAEPARHGPRVPELADPLADGSGRAVLLDDLASDPRFVALARAVDTRV
jgi:4-alpha-glucanotransferase